MVNNILKMGIENVLGLSNIPKFGSPIEDGGGSGTFSKWYEPSSMMMGTNLKR